MEELEQTSAGYEEAMPVDSLRWWTAAVVDAAVELPGVRTLTLAVPGWLGHAAGQYVDVRRTMPSGHQSARSYSIASAPEEGERLRLTIQEVPGGEVSPFLTRDVRRGDQLALRGPLGADFAWTVADGGPLLLIAGGSGIAPLMAMLRQRALRQSRVPARLLYSARTADEIIYRAELAALAAGDPNLDVTYTLTRETRPGGTGYRRRIDSAMLNAVSWPAARKPLVYIAGPTSFVETAAGGLLDLGYDSSRIFTEWFSPR